MNYQVLNRIFHFDSVAEDAALFLFRQHELSSPGRPQDVVIHNAGKYANISVLSNA